MLTGFEPYSDNFFCHQNLLSEGLWKTMIPSSVARHRFTELITKSGANPYCNRTGLLIAYPL